ncbi:5-oxoprolinase subunit PxpB [Rhodospirillaceae bacterium]|jgi:KipI family sensor histidine kinase inhibitor|nr:5-oxoprolinase subunit PxpB [Rhodospirillaceae bacterium]MBT6307467.1 5-oxoprolinase subunit PxpB [Rhodospirillaceae bacterium]MDC1441617.1 5-oxoprolinase subunit PxpB [Rhodospirillaceae bacterium]
MSLEIAPTYPAFLSAGDTALVVQYGEVVDVSINRTVRQLAFAVRKLNIKGVVDIVPTMRSLMIHYDPLFLSKSALIEVVTPLLSNLEELEENNKNWLIPVCYEDEFAPDINDVSKVTNTTIDEIVRQHTLLELEVFMMGFLPGFPYVGLLPEVFDLPRRIEPRVHIPPRSISVAARQTTIYTINSPGGWHLIGRTPVDFYDANRDEPILVRAGDRIKFQAIAKSEFIEIEADIKAGAFNLEVKELL